MSRFDDVVPVSAMCSSIGTFVAVFNVKGIETIRGFLVQDADDDDK